MKNKEFETLYCTLCEYRDLGRGECPCIECIHGFGKNDMFEETKNLKNIVLPPNTEAVFQHKSVPEIKDSGERRVFESGAVRDCAEGKGRCDLLPLGEIAEWMHNEVLGNIASFVETHSLVYLHQALDLIADRHFSCKADLALEMAIHMENGLKKYPERNWENGISIHSFIDSGVRHYLKVLREDEDENHLRACVWNLMCCCWTMVNKPEMDDLPKREEHGKS